MSPNLTVSLTRLDRRGGKGYKTQHIKRFLKKETQNFQAYEGGIAKETTTDGSSSFDMGLSSGGPR